MTMNYLSADMFTRIRNGQQNRLKEVRLKKSKLCLNILDVFIKEGVIRGYRFCPENPYDIIVLLKYFRGSPVIKKLSTISKPSKRVYLSVMDLWKIDSGLGFLVLSTPKGVFSDSQARKYNVGGEVLCKLV
jgi:small subunit ribosomal protein S8